MRIYLKEMKSLEDCAIIKLFWAREESAIVETSSKYGSYCKSIAYNILYDHEDTKECVNDTYMKTWTTLPPLRPNSLSAYLAKITRNLSLNRYKKKHAAKRGGGEVPLLLDELEDSIPTRYSAEGEYEKSCEDSLISNAISNFLFNENDESRNIFIRRYFYADSINAIANRYNISEAKIKTLLYRKRKKLKVYLEREGIVL